MLSIDIIQKAVVKINKNEGAGTFDGPPVRVFDSDAYPWGIFIFFFVPVGHFYLFCPRGAIFYAFAEYRLFTVSTNSHIHFKIDKIHNMIDISVGTRYNE